LSEPAHVLTVRVDVLEAHLANPLLAVSRLLASEARAFARVDGDELQLEIRVALPDDTPASVAHAENWIRWVVHNAGVRGTLSLDH
jgi:hypothetical protein